MHLYFYSVLQIVGYAYQHIYRTSPRLQKQLITVHQVAFHFLRNPSKRLLRAIDLSPWTTHHVHFGIDHTFLIHSMWQYILCCKYVYVLFMAKQVILFNCRLGTDLLTRVYYVYVPMVTQTVEQTTAKLVVPPYI